MKKIVIASMALALVLTGCSLAKPQARQEVISPEEAQAKAVKFVNENLMQAGSEVTAKDIAEENGLYQMTIVVPGGQEIKSYLTKDGKKFFPQVMDIAEIEKKNQDSKAGQADQADNADSAAPKSDKPEIELFVMSYCPYGTQIEKGILPVAEALGDKINFTLKFCDYAMHGKKELDEQLTQYCLQKEQLNKLFGYLNCFLKAGDSAGCLKEAGVDGAKLQTCASATDKEYKVTEKFNDKTAWANGTYPPFDVFKADANKYGVKGSPSLVINGQNVSSGRDSASLLKTICSAFNSQPEECNKQLSAAAPAPGFGEGSGSDSGGGCGN